MLSLSLLLMLIAAHEVASPTPKCDNPKLLRAAAPNPTAKPLNRQPDGSGIYTVDRREDTCHKIVPVQQKQRR